MSAKPIGWRKEWMTEGGSDVRYGLCSSQRCRPASRQQESHGTCLIRMESITKQKRMSGRKIVGSATESLISILYWPSLWAVHWSPPTQEGRMGQNCMRGCSETDGGCGKSRKTASQRQAMEGGGGAPWKHTVRANGVQVHGKAAVCLVMGWTQMRVIHCFLSASTCDCWESLKNTGAKWWNRTKHPDKSCCNNKPSGASDLFKRTLGHHKVQHGALELPVCCSNSLL